MYKIHKENCTMVIAQAKNVASTLPLRPQYVGTKKAQHQRPSGPEEKKQKMWTRPHGASYTTPPTKIQNRPPEKHLIRAPKTKQKDTHTMATAQAAEEL